MGKGCVTADGTMYEGYTELHGKPIGDTGADYAKTMENLGADVSNPFDIYEKVATFYADIIEHKTKAAAKKKEEINAWRKANTALALKIR